MTLRGVPFHNVMNASGARGFFGETNSFQWPTAQKPDWTGSTLVAKTTTLEKRAGNMPFKADGLTAKEARPGCIVVNDNDEVVLNAVGLSGPGVKYLLDDGRWQAMTEPFFVSYMSTLPTATERLEELKQFVALLKPRLKEFKSQIGLQINFSCPNVGLHLEDLFNEVEEAFTRANVLGVPLVPKFNILLPPDQAVELLQNSGWDAVCVFNTIPWGQQGETIQWNSLFNSSTSPLSDIGGGGLSGKPTFKLGLAWIKEVRKLGLTKPIIGGAGILSVDDAKQTFEAGVDAINFGSVAILHPVRVSQIIEYTKGRT